MKPIDGGKLFSLKILSKNEKKKWYRSVGLDIIPIPVRLLNVQFHGFYLG